MPGRVPVHYPAGTGVIYQRTLAAAFLATNAVTGAKISAGTVTNAKLSSPESVYPMHFALDKVPANLGRQSVVLGWTPLAAIPIKLTLTARNAVVNKVNVWPVNAAGSLMCASTFTPTGGALASAALVVNAIAAGERIRLWAKASTTTSAMGLNAVLWLKSNHTT